MRKRVSGLKYAAGWKRGRANWQTISSMQHTSEAPAGANLRPPVPLMYAALDRYITRGEQKAYDKTCRS